MHRCQAPVLLFTAYSVRKKILRNYFTAISSGTVFVKFKSFLLNEQWLTKNRFK